ncbi:MAG: TolC family protein [Vicinamibacterales bacterium]
MRMRTWCVAVAVLTCSLPTAAQTVLSEAEALARLSADSPRVRAIRAAVDIARAEALAARQWPNPRLSVNREAVAGVTEHMVTVTQALPITGRRGLDIRAATASADAAASRADDDLRQARADLRTAYADLVVAQAREAALQRSRDGLQALAEILARREAAGDAAGYDRLRAEREVSEVELELAEARADRAGAQATLGAFLVDSPGATTLVAVAPQVGTRLPLPGVDDLVARATAVRGEPAALQQEIASARLAEQAASRRRIPEPEVVAGTKSSNAGIGDVGSVLSVHIAIPLFDRAQTERAIARARRSEAEARSAVFHASLRARTSALHALVTERRLAADRYRSTASANLETLERIAQVSYDAGERGILELLDAYRGSAAVRTQQAMLDAAVRQAEIALELVTGWEMQ